MKSLLQLILILSIIIAPLIVLKMLSDAPIKTVTYDIISGSSLEGFCKIKRISLCPIETNVVAVLVDR